MYCDICLVVTSSYLGLLLDKNSSTGTENQGIKTCIGCNLCDYLWSLKILWKITEKTAILDFINNALSKVLSGYTTMSGLPTNPMVDTIIVNLLLFC